MVGSIEDQVVDLYGRLFEAVFSEPFRAAIDERIRRNAVIRQVEESADAASQSLTRFFVNELLTPEQVAAVLAGFEKLPRILGLEEIANPNITPESTVERLLKDVPCPDGVDAAGHAPVYRVALHSTIQVLTLVGPVMAEWRKLRFSSTFELPRRVVRRLNEISQQLGDAGGAGEDAGDERYELNYRDYLLQRFHRVEAGTVRMTTSVGVDLRELFVMPQVRPRPTRATKKSGEPSDEAAALMGLATAREFFGRTDDDDDDDGKKPRKPPSALAQVRKRRRNVIVGAPGSGKSTFLEWLQLQVASVDEEFVLAGEQAIPVLLRVRQLDVQHLPEGSAVIEKATASTDWADLMPDGWLDRQMGAGRVLFMLDGLDEIEPELRDEYVIPWLLAIIERYPNCHYVISSRPTGYPPGTLRKLKFAECDLLDFEDPQIGEYARHWCTAIRLAQNEPETEARREGSREGGEIVKSFEKNQYIRHLARNPLMLSAICLVNYFEGGQLPEDRAPLYKLCVEGLLHHWDQRRGIHSQYPLNQKLRVCREVAIAMQADDKAEYQAAQVEQVFATVLNDATKAAALLEHIRYRTGLLVERRAGVFAFAHLTFQEYLAAQAVHEGNLRKIDADQLVREHGDGRWKEVISLYCGLTPDRASREMVEQLITREDTAALGPVLADAYLSSGSELRQNGELRRRVLERVALSPSAPAGSVLDGFSVEEVAPAANAQVGRMRGATKVLSVAFYWLRSNLSHIDTSCLLQRLRAWRGIDPRPLTEPVYLIHRHASDRVLARLAREPALYRAAGPHFSGDEEYASQAEIALLGLGDAATRMEPESSPGRDAVLLIIMRTLTDRVFAQATHRSIARFFERGAGLPSEPATWPEFSSQARRLQERLTGRQGGRWYSADEAIKALNAWADRLDRAIAENEAKPTGKRAKGKASATKKKSSAASKRTPGAKKKATSKKAFKRSGPKAASTKKKKTTRKKASRR